MRFLACFCLGDYRGLTGGSYGNPDIGVIGSGRALSGLHRYLRPAYRTWNPETHPRENISKNTCRAAPSRAAARLKIEK
jgi:hypothetical protein